MDLARILIRSYARAFYGVEHILVLDAVIMHLALSGEDLAYVLGSQPKYTRKLCNKLREDGLLHQHIQQEIKQGANRASGREYYYINMHRAIDNIKWRLKSLDNAVATKYGRPEDEKKDYFCQQCKSEYDTLDAMDTFDWQGNFTCKRCGDRLVQRLNDKNSAGHERHRKLNDQLTACYDLMKRIDATSITENDWEHAYENRRAVERNQALNPGVKSEVVPPRFASNTVNGRAVEQEKLHVELHDSASAQEAEARKRELDKKAAAQNQLPIWHTNSTVTGEQTALGRKEAEEKRQRDLVYGGGEADTEEKSKVAVDEMEESEQMRAYKAAVRAAAEQEAAEEEEEEDDDVDDEAEDDDEDEFEDVEIAPNKRVKLADGSGGTGQVSKPDVTPAVNSTMATEKPTTNGTAPNATNANGSKNDEEDDSDEDANFEDVL